MINCPKCGKQLPDGSKFCKFCGNPITMMPMPSQAPVTPNNVQKSVSQKPDNGKVSKNNKKSAKSIIFAVIAVILVIAIAVTGWFVWDYFDGKKEEESLTEKEKLMKVLEESTTKPIVDFVYDDYDSDDTYEAYAVVGKTSDDDDKHPEFHDADIYFVNNKKAQKIKENVSGQVNGKIKLDDTKYISIEVYEDGTNEGKSFVYTNKGTKFVEPDISGKYSRVRFEDGKLVAEENGKKIEVDINGNKLTVDYDPAVYEETVLAQYRKVMSSGFDNLSDDEKTYLHEELLNFYESGDAIRYALYDIDNNGVEELFISLESSYLFYDCIYAMYTYDGKNVHYAEGSGYKYSLFAKSNGKMIQHCNYGTGSCGATVYAIDEDGYTLDGEIHIYYMYNPDPHFYKNTGDESVEISESEFNSLKSQYGLDDYLQTESDIDFDWIELTPDNESGNSRPYNVPADAVYFNGNYYKIYDEELTWDEAVARCEELGGHLCTVTSEDEQINIENLINSGTKYTYWLGGKSTPNEWYWVTGEDFIYSNWASNEPNHFNGTEDCLMIYNEPNVSNGSSFGKWNDLTSDCYCVGDEFFSPDIFGFICEWEGN